MSNVISDIEVVGKSINRRMIRNVWQRLFRNKPLPTIWALRVSPQEFQRVWLALDEHNRKSGDAMCTARAMIREHGGLVVPSAGVCKVQGGYLVLVRTDSAWPLVHDLEHELGHIARGEV